MNDEAREILVAAGLRGDKQAIGKLHDRDGADCAMGKLHLAMHATRDEALLCSNSGGYVFGACGKALVKRFDMANSQWEVTDANNNRRWDFLTIARKVGVKEETS